MGLKSPPNIDGLPEVTDWLLSVYHYLLDRTSDFVSAPATSTSEGVPGQRSYDDDFFYICTATNTWKRIPFQFRWDTWWVW